MRTKVRPFIASNVLLVLFSCQSDFKAGGYASTKPDGAVDADGMTTGMLDVGSDGPDRTYSTDAISDGSDARGGADAGGGSDASGGAPGDGGTSGSGGAGSGGQRTPDAAWSSGDLVNSRPAGDAASEPKTAGGIAGAAGTSAAGGASASGGAPARIDAGTAPEPDAPLPLIIPANVDGGAAPQVDAPVPVEPDAAATEAKPSDSHPPPQAGATGTGGVSNTGGVQGSGGVSGGQTSAGSSGTNLYAPEKYLILMDDQFVGHARLQDFVQWKTEKGYRVETITTSMIDSSGAPSHEQIANTMKQLPAEEYPRYLLIIGDADPANGVAAYKFQSAGVPPEYSNLFAYPQ